MDKHNLWSIRLGFSGKQSPLIATMGLEQFLEASFASKFSPDIPEFLKDSPKTLQALRAKRQTLQSSSAEEAKEMLKKELQVSFEMKSWWISKMQSEDYPLREKMTCFWHNHFVSTYQKVKVNHWVFQHNQLLREHAFGNFKTLTKQVLQTNAMVRYLDNVDNRREKINENLSRELLELFTLGIGNYSEEDIKNGAKGLAGLNLGEDKAIYRKLLENNDTITYFGKTGTFKADELVDIIFEQKAVPYLLTRKILQWFIYDTPPEALVEYYGDYFRKVNFEIKPLLTKIFTEEFQKDNAGSKIKDPLVYILQLLHELNASNMNPKLIAFFLKQQGMDLFNQPNVKGWNGGKEWLTSQIYLQRNNVADLLCDGRSWNRRIQFTEDSMNESMPKLKVKVNYNKNGNHQTIISELSNKLLFKNDENGQQEWESILKYDFNPKAENADYAVLRLFNAMIKTPEFQIV